MCIFGLGMFYCYSQLNVLQGIEFPSFGVVTLMVIGVVDSGGSGYCFSFALTSVFARLLVLLRLRHGFSILLSSLLLGFRIFLMDFVSRLGV